MIRKPFIKDQILEHIPFILGAAAGGFLIALFAFSGILNNLEEEPKYKTIIFGRTHLNTEVYCAENNNKCYVTPETLDWLTHHLK